MPAAHQLSHHKLARDEALDLGVPDHGRITIRSIGRKESELVLQAPPAVVVMPEEPRRRLVLSRLRGQTIVLLLQDGSKLEFAVVSDAGRFEIEAPRRVGIWRREIAAGKRPPATGNESADDGAA